MTGLKYVPKSWLREMNTWSIATSVKVLCYLSSSRLGLKIMARPKIKITVLKRVSPEVIFDGNVPPKPDGGKYTVCTAFEDGQEFIANGLEKPEGFCSWAWRDIFKDLSVLLFGGSFHPWVDHGKQITCCTDGIRPVSFVLERIEE